MMNLPFTIIGEKYEAILLNFHYYNGNEKVNCSGKSGVD